MHTKKQFRNNIDFFHLETLCLSYKPILRFCEVHLKIWNQSCPTGEITCRVIFLKFSEKTFRKTIDNVGGSVRVRV